MNDAEKTASLAAALGVPLNALAAALGVSRVQFYYLRIGRAEIHPGSHLMLRRMREVLTILQQEGVLPTKDGTKFERAMFARSKFLALMRTLDADFD